jgi:phospholipid transport system transporter-binding protein
MEIQSTPPLRLPADCSISGIRAVYELIRKSLRLQQQLEIDCSSVDKADLTSVQLLLSATRTADEQGGRLSLNAVSQTLRTTFQRAGVSTGAMSDRPSTEQKESQ